MTLKDKNPRTIEDTIECVEELARIVKENKLGKLKVSTEDVDITIEGGRCPHPPVHGAPPMGMPPVGAPHPMGAPHPSPDLAKPAEEAAPESGNFITSPIIGTFYSSPAPEKPCYVKVGDTINAGDVVCIIESMKLMNEINSDFSGKVAEIYVNNGEFVEFGQKLMRIE